MKHRPVPECGSGRVLDLEQRDPLKAVRESEAYTSGFNIGLQGTLGLNPYGRDTINHEYWKLGCTAGYITIAA